MSDSAARPMPPLTATLTPHEATGSRWQAVVVGAGPAGAATALRLAARGVRVLLVDRGMLPRWKVCGCCLSPAAMRELRHLARPTAASAEPPLGVSPLDTVRVCHGGRSVLLPMAGGGVASREYLDTALVMQAIEAGAHWLPATQVTSIDDAPTPGRPDRVTLAVRSMADAADHPAPLTAEHAVLATGLTDSVRVDTGAADRAPEAAGLSTDDSRIGLGATLEATAFDLAPGQLVMAVAKMGYCGVVRLEDGRIDLAAAVDRSALGHHATPAAAVLAILTRAIDGFGSSPASTDAIMAAHFRATPTLTRRAPLIAGTSGRVLRIGDAAGYVEPFTGEGIGWALAAGRLVAESLLDTADPAAGRLRPPADAARRYQTAHRRHFAPRHARCRRVSLALRRPAVVLTAMHAARAAPWVARRLMPLVLGAGPEEGLVS